MLVIASSTYLSLLTGRPPVGTLEPLTTWSGVAMTWYVEVNPNGLYPLPPLFFSSLPQLPQVGAAEAAVAQSAAAAMVENFMVSWWLLCLEWCKVVRKKDVLSCCELEWIDVEYDQDKHRQDTRLIYNLRTELLPVRLWHSSCLIFRRSCLCQERDKWRRHHCREC